MRVLVATISILLSVIALSILFDLAGSQLLLAANSNSLLVGKAAYGDWRSDSPATPVHYAVRPTSAL